MKKSQKAVSYTLILAVFLLIIIILLIPLFSLARYSLPCLDDFDYSGQAYHVFKETGSLPKVLATAVEVSRSFYTSWQGTFSAAFMMSLQPGIFGDSFYPLTAAIMLLPLLGGIMFFCTELFSGLFGLKKRVSCIAGALIYILCIQLVPMAREAFFWYNGAVFYTFFFSVSLILYALGIRYLRLGGRARYISLIVLAVFVGGGNYITALSSAIILFSTAALLFLLKHEKKISFTVLTLVSIAALAVNMLAPGNTVRGESTGGGPGAIASVLLSFRYAAVKAADWFSLPLLAVLIFLAVLFIFALPRAGFKFRMPALISAYSFCLLAAMFCPTTYALGEMAHGRVQNIIYFAYVILLAVNLYYWLGWISAKKSVLSENAAGLPILTAAAAAVVSLALCAVYLAGGGSLLSASALGALRQGEPQQYYAEAMAQRAVLFNPEIKDAVIDRIETHPTLLYSPDEGIDPWLLGSIAFYYEKDSVEFR